VAKQLDAQIDHLYQLPLEQFTSARNALAKEAGPDAAGIRTLTKPPVAAWAVNQLFWNRRDDYDTLIDAAQEMRKTHKAVIEGRRGDLRSAGREHELALERALKATADLLGERGVPVTDATRHTILNTLRALPSDEPPGRLSKTLAPGGFEMLAGVKPAKGAARPKRDTDRRLQAVKDTRKSESTEQETSRAEREALERAIRDAEHHHRRTEFEAARAVREATKADKRLDEAQRTLEAAREEVAAAERDAATARRAREAAERKRLDTESALQAARDAKDRSGAASRRTRG
jgi:hypothetical protein